MNFGTKEIETNAFVKWLCSNWSQFLLQYQGAVCTNYKITEIGKALQTTEVSTPFFHGSKALRPKLW